MDSTYISGLNKLSTGGAWLWLLEITTPIYATPLRYTSDNQATVWNGETYSPIPFSMTDVSISADGKFPENQVEIEDGDLGSGLRTRVKATDGLKNGTIRFMVVHSAYLATLTEPALNEYADILDCTLTARSVVLTVGIPSLLTRRFPRDRYVPGFCRHRFKGALCKYTQQTNYTLSSTDADFVLGSSYNRIFINDPEQNLVYDLFRYALPRGEIRSGMLYLAKDAAFTLTGSSYNDGFFLADMNRPVRAHYVDVKPESESGQAFFAESGVVGVYLSLGYAACDHTLAACKIRDNVANFGGSPGIVGGVYG